MARYHQNRGLAVCETRVEHAGDHGHYMAADLPKAPSGSDSG
jgi:hypothetical protein